jgi:hypothetical protein
MARELTGDELIALRSNGQPSQLKAAILKPFTILTCRVNQTFASNDKLAQITYDGATGTYTDIQPGMLVRVGTSAGARDVGTCRVRKAATSSVLYLGENSGLAWADNLYITVVDDFHIHPQHIFSLDDHSIKIDYDVAYAAQHATFAPVVVMGSHAVATLVEGTAAIAFDASASWCLSAGGKAYSWSASSGTFDNASSATPTLTVDAWVQHVTVKCTVTVNSVSSSGYRYVFLFDETHLPYVPEITGDPSGDYDNGGWQFSLRYYAGISDVEEGALVVLFAEDWYAGVAGGIGPLPGRENIIAWGWIAGEGLVQDPHGGSVEFTVQGPHWWLQKIEYPIGVELSDTQTTPASWKEIQGLTVDKALFHLLYYRSTAMQCIDVILSGDTRQAPTLLAQPETLWGQMQEIAAKKIHARPCCDRFGRLYVEIDAQMLPQSARNAIPVVQTLTKVDWREAIEITRKSVDTVAQIDLSTIYHSGGVSTVLYSLYPGHIPNSQGSLRIADNYLAASQSDANQMAGLLVAVENIPYEFRILPAANQRMIDICPRQYLGLVIGVNDTPRGIGYTGNAIVREVSFEMQANGFLAPSWEAEAVSVILTGVTGDIPLEDGTLQAISPIKEFGEISFPQLPLELGGWDGAYGSPPTYDNAPEKAVVLVTAPARRVAYTRNFNRLSGQTWYSMNFGLLSTDLTDLVWLTANRAGRVYLASTKKVWSAYVGETWKLIHDFTSAPERIWSIGCNPLAADSLGLVVGKSSPYEYAHFYLGNASGITQKDELTYPPAFEGGTLSYGAGKWIFTHTQGGASNGYLSRFSGAGAYETSIATVNVGGVYHYHARAGTADRILHYPASGIYTDGGATFDDITPPSPLVNDFQTAAITADGVRAMALGVDNRIRKSSDGGLSWSTLPTGTLGVYSNYACVENIDANRWAFAHGFFGVQVPRVFYSPDFGVNWTEKTGNLRDVVGTDFRPATLKVIA